MPKITYIEQDGTERTVEAEVGATVMETAINNDIPGIRDLRRLLLLRHLPRLCG